MGLKKLETVSYIIVDRCI